MNNLNKEGLKVGLKMNRKTKVKFNGRVQFEQILVQSEALEIVDEYLYTYLEQLIQINIPDAEEIK